MAGVPGGMLLAFPTRRDARFEDIVKASECNSQNWARPLSSHTRGEPADAGAAGGAAGAAGAAGECVMTPASVARLCRERGGYIVPALNTTLYLQQPDDGMTHGGLGRKRNSEDSRASEDSPTLHKAKRGSHQNLCALDPDGGASGRPSLALLMAPAARSASLGMSRTMSMPNTDEWEAVTPRRGFGRSTPPRVSGVVVVGLGNRSGSRDPPLLARRFTEDSAAGTSARSSREHAVPRTGRSSNEAGTPGRKSLEEDDDIAWVPIPAERLRLKGLARAISVGSGLVSLADLVRDDNEDEIFRDFAKPSGPLAPGAARDSIGSGPGSGPAGAAAAAAAAEAGPDGGRRVPIVEYRQSRDGQFKPLASGAEVATVRLSRHSSAAAVEEECAALFGRRGGEQLMVKRFGGGPALSFSELSMAELEALDAGDELMFVRPAVLANANKRGWLSAWFRL